MVTGRPSKVLSGWSYESEPKPLRSSRTAGTFCETEVPETEDEGASSPDFIEFSTLLANGQRIANDTNKTYTFIWRGYKACVSSQLPNMTTFEMKRRFSLAMQSIEENNNFKKPEIYTQEPTQIPETQFDMEGIFYFIFLLTRRNDILMLS